MTPKNRMFALRAVVAWMSLMSCVSAFGITWSDHEVEDPFSDSTCKVSSPMSSGSYIYQYPSKLDGVYWPHTSMRWVWHCPESGYTSFGNDFADLTGQETQRISDALNAIDVSVLAPGDSTRLLLLETIYRLRDMDEQFWGWFYRVKANLLETLADNSRYDSIPYLENAARSETNDFSKLQATFVLGHYMHKFGDSDKAKALFDQAKGMPWIDNDGNQQIGSDYINGLISEVEALNP